MAWCAAQAAELPSAEETGGSGERAGAQLHGHPARPERRRTLAGCLHPRCQAESLLPPHELASGQAGGRGHRSSRSTGVRATGDPPRPKSFSRPRAHIMLG
ncbi:MAG: hypothetical protein NTV25_04615 [Methanothrix sp.]|nr:hypothetical protein [Methanothrix sp.]